MIIDRNKTNHSCNGNVKGNDKISNATYSGSTNSVNSDGGECCTNMGMVNQPKQATNVNQSQVYSQHQNVIPSNAIRTPITSKHVRSHSAIDPLITVTGTFHSNKHIQHTIGNVNQLSSHHKNSVNSLISSTTNGTLKLSSKSSSLNFLSSIEEKVARLYYRHGLFCSRHPLWTICFTLLIVSISSYPIVTFSRLFGSSSEVYMTTSNTYTLNGQTKSFHRHESDKNNPITNSILLQAEKYSFLKHLFFWENSSNNNENIQQHSVDHNVPRWFQPNLSYAFVQQIYVRSAVIPWTPEMQLVDALRGPLDILFELIESISNYQQHNNKTGEDITLNDLCLQVFEPILHHRYHNLASHLPSYSCLMLSPANIWRELNQFRQDDKLLSTLLKYHETTDTPLPVGSLHNIFFGVNFDQTGIRRTYGRNRQRTITYAITIVLRQHSPTFIEGLRRFLTSRYPLSEPYHSGHNESLESMDEKEDLYHVPDETFHIFFQNTFTLAYMVPLLLFYFLVCLYMYFVVRKIEIVRNKLLYAFGTLLTVMMSVFMSLGICVRLDFNSVLFVNQFIPYFVAVFSFENMLVLTKSMSTQYQHLDSKVKVAQGLSREGLSITKNLLSALTLLMIGSLAFPPFFQDCCIFAVICLVTDFFIQVTFFISLISINIQSINAKGAKNNNIGKMDLLYPKNVYAHPSNPKLKKTPKRLRIIYFFARIRIIQRIFVLTMVACIGSAIYSAYLVLNQTTPADEFRQANAHNYTSEAIFQESASVTKKFSSHSNKNMMSSSINQSNRDNNLQSRLEEISSNNNNEHSLIELLKSANPSSLKPTENLISTKGLLDKLFDRIRFTCEHSVISMPNHHWTNLFSLYNISLTGRFVSILPPILLSIPIKPEQAQSVRNEADSDDNILRKFIPMKFNNGEYIIIDDDFDEYEQELPNHFFSNWSRTDLYITIGLSIPSFIFFVYIFIQLYRCVCTRNYAEWRSQLTFSLNQPLNLLIQVKTILRLTNTYGYQQLEQMEKFLKFDFHNLTINYDNESYQNDSQFMLNNQDIDLISVSKTNSLVASSSMSSDIRVYDSLTCETLTYIKRSKATANDSIQNEETLVGVPQRVNHLSSNSPIKNETVIARSSGNLLKTIINGIGMEIDNEYRNDLGNGNEKCSLDGFEWRPIWCIEMFDRYVLAGCGIDGRLEVWDAYSGELAYVHYPDHHDRSDPQSANITVMRTTFWGVVIARINGTLDLLEVDQQKDMKCSFGSMINQRTSTINNKSSNNVQTSKECQNLMETKFSIKYRLRNTVQAHQQPITRMEIIDSLEEEDFIRAFGSRGCLITGSLDNTLKVFALDQAKFMYTLNGHYGGISATSIDQHSTATALSGCQLGQLFVWDLITGTCIFSMQAHSQAEVLAITSSQLYYVSTGTDDRICIWDRFSGHLVHQISQQHSSCRNIMFLESHILITVRHDELVVWDVNDARQMCIISLANQTKNLEQVKREDLSSDSLIQSYQTAAIQQLYFSSQHRSLICDFGNSLCVINNPFAMTKLD